MTSDSIKNPHHEAENPAPMPNASVKAGKEHRAKMAVHSDSPPGIELDGKAHVIPLEQRTEGDREKAKKAR